jgi:hypothetical protein
LHRYLAELDFRYSNRVRLGVDDVERTEHAVKRAVKETHRLIRQMQHMPADDAPGHRFEEVRMRDRVEIFVNLGLRLRLAGLG